MKSMIGIGFALGCVALVFVAWKKDVLLRRFAALSTQRNLPLSVKKPLPLLQYTIPNLQQRQFSGSQIIAERSLEEHADYTAYLFSFTTLGKKMTGQLNIPKNSTQSAIPTPVLFLVRGYVPSEKYVTGAGTKAAAAVFAQHGYVTLAPDFFSFGESDPESTNSWEARFQKALSLAELLQSASNSAHITLPTGESISLSDQKRGIWAHSNGGQIALTTLEITRAALPTTLWAPVTAPFPYSVSFFSDEDADEGRAARDSIALFEQEYDARQFSLTTFLSDLRAPLQIHQGEIDEAIHYPWSQEFVEKVHKENPDLPIKLFLYPNTDHNMKPSWSTAIQRDLDFFAQEWQKAAQSGL